METKWLKAKELAKLWGLSSRRVNQLCKENLLPGAYKSGKFWMIPSDVEKPETVRKKKIQTEEMKIQPNFTRPCPVGITSYKEVAKECYYVDKTLLLKNIIDDHSKVFLFTRPRRFGKTLMMDMVRTFFEKSDVNTSQYFENKKIWQEGELYQQYQGKYPVIFFSFKDAHQTNWEEMYKSLCFTIREEFSRHIELLSSESLTEYDKKYFENIMRDTAESTEYQFALGKLSAMLAVHYKSKVIIIIDEYDTPIQQGYLHGYYDSVVGFMRNLFSAALKDNENLEFGVLTGILRIAKESLFSGLNNLVVNTILDEKYSAYFGFTPQEVQEMSIYYGKPEKVQEIKDWYDGYLFGRQEIYNPWSVINYFSNDCKPKAFWSRTSGNEIIGQMIRNSNNQIYENLTLLLQGKEVQAIVDTDIIYPEIDENSDAIYSFLLVSGYLRVTNVISEMNDTPICSLAIPNREIKSVFQKEIMDQNGKLFTGTILRNFEMSLRTGDADLFTNTLQNYLMQSASCFDTAQENFYHGMVFGMLAIMTDKYYISSNREVGDGRLDIQLEPKEKNQKGYIIEFKAGKELAGEQLEELAGNAIAQIYDKNYLEEMRQRGITEIGLFGIGFSGKHVVVKYENNVEGI